LFKHSSYKRERCLTAVHTSTLYQFPDISTTYNMPGLVLKPRTAKFCVCLSLSSKTN